MLPRPSRASISRPRRRRWYAISWSAASCATMRRPAPAQAGRYFHREAFHTLSRDREARLRRPDRPPGLFRCLRSISFVTPKTRARDALAAMEKCLFNVNDHREIGYSAIICHRAPDILIPDNDGTTGNAKRFALTRNKEDQAGRPDSAARCERYRRGGCHDDPEWQGSLRQDRLQIPRDLPLVTDQPGQTDRLNPPRQTATRR